MIYPKGKLEKRKAVSLAVHGTKKGMMHLLSFLADQIQIFLEPHQTEGTWKMQTQACVVQRLLLCTKLHTFMLGK